MSNAIMTDVGEAAINQCKFFRSSTRLLRIYSVGYFMDCSIPWVTPGYGVYQSYNAI